MILIDNYSSVYRKRRRALISGEAPQGASRVRRRVYQNLMSAEPAWERNGHLAGDREGHRGRDLTQPGEGRSFS